MNEKSYSDDYQRGYQEAIDFVEETISNLQSSIADVLQLYDPASHGNMRPPSSDTYILLLHSMYTTLEALHVACIEGKDYSGESSGR
jgi:hypothetical protein